MIALILLAGLAAAQPPVLDPNRAEFPDSSLVDFGARLPADGGRRGFLRVDPAGRFVWPDGERARFWGINIASESVCQPPERIDTVIERFRRAGFNLVRIHHIDDPGRGILVPGETLRFDPQRLRVLDTWIDHLGRAGLHVYLDLLDYRTFPADAVEGDPARLGRGAKPYAVFAPKLIADQQKYAKALLRDHVNPLNGKCYADDPTIVMIELYDENGLFIRRGDWTRLASPYREELQARWNQFLKDRYGSTAGLAAAWSRSGVARPLPAGQRLEDGTVPLMPPRLDEPGPARTAAARLERARSSDAARFAWQVQGAYLAEMRQFLTEEVGVRVPLTAIGDSQIVPDQSAVAAHLDFVGTNFYFDHPIFAGGNDWRSPFFFQLGNPVAESGSAAFAPFVTLARVADKPLVVREWNHCYPNPYRAAGMVEAAAYAALQDLDAMILFTYGAVETSRQVGYFDVHQDPARWGLAAVLGELYRTGAVSPARRSVEIGYGDLDTFLFKDYRTDLRDLAWVSRLSNRCFGDELAPQADLTVASGRSAAPVYRSGPVVLSRNDSAVSSLGEMNHQSEGFLGYPARLVQGAAGEYHFDGSLLYPAGARQRSAGGRFLVADLAALGAVPVGLGADDALGFRDEVRRVFGFGPLTGREQARAALDALSALYGTGGAEMETWERYVCDTGETVRDARAGRLQITAPRVAAVAGDLSQGPFRLGDLRFETATDRGAAVVLSLDGRPIGECQSLVVKLVSDAANEGLRLTSPRAPGNPRPYYRLDDPGDARVRTGGRPVSSGWRIYRRGELLCAVGLAGGTAELVLERGQWRWYVDTPGVWVRPAGATAATIVLADGTTRQADPADAWRFPDDALLMQSP